MTNKELIKTTTDIFKIRQSGMISIPEKKWYPLTEHETEIKVLLNANHKQGFEIDNYIIALNILQKENQELKEQIELLETKLETCHLKRLP